jgi:hypothetical protein
MSNEQQTPYSTWTQIILVLLLTAGAFWVPQLVRGHISDNCNTRWPSLSERGLLYSPGGVAPVRAQAQRTCLAAQRAASLAVEGFAAP